MKKKSILIFIILILISAALLIKVAGVINGFKEKQSGSITVKLMIGRDKQWIFDEVQIILTQNNIKINGKSINIVTDKAGSGEAMEKILEPNSSYVGWMPASSTYIEWANERWYHNGNVKPRVNEEATTVFLTPTVIAMKDSLARLMGYPDQKIGWEEILDLSTSKEGWDKYGNSSLNPVRFSHTHPAKSNSGLNALIAEEYAFSNKTKELSIDDIKKNSDKLKAVEQTVVYYGQSTSLLQNKIVEKGSNFIQYAVLYEYMVAEMNRNSSNMEKTVAIYPKEGTIWGDVSFTEVYSTGVSDEQKQALSKIKEILLSERVQKKGMNEYFFRPANTNIPLSNEFLAGEGIDPSEPKTTLELPKIDIINAILDDWQNNMKKRANVTFILDTSESMRGQALENVKIAMKAIFSTNSNANNYSTISGEDYISLIDFNSEISDVLSVKGNDMDRMTSKISALQVKGATRLYDAISKGIDSNNDVVSSEDKHNKRINLLIVLTDGIDTNSKTQYEQLINSISSHQGNIPVIMTVGYGDVDERVLTNIAEITGGKYYKGNPQTIMQIFDEIRSYF